jgi:hypothetical protein
MREVNNGFKYAFWAVIGTAVALGWLSFLVVISDAVRPVLAAAWGAL